MATPLFTPKLFGWAHQIENELLRTITAKSSAGAMRTLAAAEAHLLTILFLRSVVAHLSFFCKVRRVTTSHVSPLEIAEWEKRRRTGQKLTEAQWEKQKDRLITQIGEAASQIIDFQIQRLLRGHEAGPSVESVLEKEPHAGAFFLHSLAERWRVCSPALKFFLIGGGELVTIATAQNPPPKFLKEAIYELGVRGGLPKKPSSSAPRVSSLEARREPRTKDQLKLPSHAICPTGLKTDVFAEARGLPITDDQVAFARKSLRNIPDHPFLLSTVYVDRDRNRSIASQAHGLTAVPSLKGRRKSPGREAENKGKKKCTIKAQHSPS